ncbi:NAD(P)-binding domain-containing protein [Amycolatopsis sp. A133]|uniref:NAD(P)-dependent oxidoreductase n=1 Tax=Amycolatopsis sp. A133 TaxID=3064472 RepID=UPI0027E622B1|nr:NAD(P)-binding domain-containing protein [Amycolatopsis sp. A133]MDQ7809119.1 NAD(P)-binding domain-containing protein [Amycolatopsis sp. A133]
MAGNDHTPVTVIGLGSMGSALAEAFIGAGHTTTVWNRTAGKAGSLVDKGAVAAPTVREAVTASPLVVVCLSTYDATIHTLEHAGAELAGHTLVTLNTGTPDGARRMAGWASGHGARFLDGAIKNVPIAVGKPDTLLYYSGDKAVFDEHEATLRVLGGDTVHLGEQPDLAALYEMAVGGVLLPSLLAFFQGTTYVTARGLQADTLVRYTAKWLEMIISALPHLAKQIDTRDYTGPIGATVGIFEEVLAEQRHYGRQEHVDVSWQAPIHHILNRAIAEGHRDHSISALVEMLRKPEQSA